MLPDCSKLLFAILNLKLFFCSRSKSQTCILTLSLNFFSLFYSFATLSILLLVQLLFILPYHSPSTLPQIYYTFLLQSLEKPQSYKKRLARVKSLALVSRKSCGQLALDTRSLAGLFLRPAGSGARRADAAYITQEDIPQANRG